MNELRGAKVDGFTILGIEVERGGKLKITLPEEAYDHLLSQAYVVHQVAREDRMEYDLIKALSEVIYALKKNGYETGISHD